MRKQTLTPPDPIPLLHRLGIWLLVLLIALVPTTSTLAVMAPYEAQDGYGLRNHLQRRSLAERISEMYPLINSIDFYIPNPRALSEAEICYHLMFYAQKYSITENLYHTCFYRSTPDRVARAFRMLVEQHIIEAMNGADAVRHNYELIDYASRLFAHLFSELQTSNPRQPKSLRESYRDFIDNNHDIAVQVPNSDAWSIFEQGFLHFSRLLQVGSRQRLSGVQLKNDLKISISQYWSSYLKSKRPDFNLLKKVRQAKDDLGLALLRPRLLCESMLTKAAEPVLSP